MPVSPPPTFIDPVQAPIALTGASVGEVIGVVSVAPVRLGLTSGGSGAGTGNGTIGPAVAYSPASGAVDPGAGITGFTVATASAQGTGRLNITLAGNTTFAGLPAGRDGQLLTLVIVSGAFTLSLTEGGSTAGAPFFGLGLFELPGVGATQLLYYDSTLGWVLM